MNDKGTWIIKQSGERTKQLSSCLISGHITKLDQETVFQSLISNCISITFIKGVFTASLSKQNILNFKCCLYFIVKKWFTCLLTFSIAYKFTNAFLHIELVVFKIFKHCFSGIWIAYYCSVCQWRVWVKVE